MYDVEVHVDEGSVPLRTTNISIGGAFLPADPADYPQLEVGIVIRVTLFVAHVVGADINCAAKIVRVEAAPVEGRSGFAVKFSGLDPPNLMRLTKLVAKGNKLLDERHSRTSEF
jgi:hypothetical protein